LAFQQYKGWGVADRVFITKNASACSLSNVITLLFSCCLSADFLILIPTICTIFYIDSTQTQPLITNKNSRTIANAMEIASKEGISALPPPLPCIAPVLHAPGKGDGQNWLLASAEIAVKVVATPQPRQRWTRMSPLSRRGKWWPQTPPSAGEVKNNNQLATGESKAGSGWQESVDNHMTMMASNDKQQEHAADDEGSNKEGKGSKGNNE
jgi:hypothetical protein